MPFELINPQGLEAPVGYSHVAKIDGGSVVRVAGQAPFDDKGQVVGKGDFVVQFTQVMRNLKTAIEAVGGRPTHYAELTIYVTNLEAYWENKKPLGSAYREIFGKYFPAITLVEVKRLYNPDCMIEISGVAVLD
ncbi:MAG TPA: RidA family protein [Candidatus Binatia bacterium]|jgi:enamine deaminase RidA (YjgF/YER057c/UK114 family)|nr:RidA family protein [Candidatus Binatia bacterium]